jgi:uncharacterized protein
MSQSPHILPPASTLIVGIGAATALLTMIVIAAGQPSNEERAHGAHRTPSWCNSQDTFNRAERTVCDSALLSELDLKLSEVYQRSNASIESQRRWVARRNDCGSSERCLASVYEERISELGGGGTGR